ncbi:hypothetical protein PVK06_048365 [Gossypium arboreum]|uniref:Putative plant transposon protein domain-containing protein n=1 Tax=Gossypium arboreum TaxID=29729 RepID=A0ABR0MG84_GOSAR|nr:hypothetical protein PVK06_048365 [Gossypium arboreum]
MPRKKTRAFTQIDETQNKFHYEEAKRPSVDEELVREFYANLTSGEMIEVPVRGIKVLINSNAINKFFELPDLENDEYSTLMSNIKPENLREILEELIVEGSSWTVSKQGTHTCRREYLTPIAKISYSSHGLHSRKRSEAIHAKAIVTEQKMSQIRKGLQINKGRILTLFYLYS